MACFPAHMVPGRFTDSVKELWPKITKFPTWTFSLASREWRPLNCEPIHFLPDWSAVDQRGKVSSRSPLSVASVPDRILP